MENISENETDTEIRRKHEKPGAVALFYKRSQRNFQNRAIIREILYTSDEDVREKKSAKGKFRISGAQ